MREDDWQSLHLLLYGRVQGVGFRFFVKQCVENLNIFGWVRNLRDGKVEIFVEGNRQDLENFLAVVSKGPNISLVENIEINWGNSSGKFENFRIAATAQSRK